MRFGCILLLLSFTAGIAGCDEGGCYYTCCISDSDCTAECITGIKNAEQCAIRAQEDCSEGDEGYLTRVQWTEINKLVCDHCGSSACAPKWWTAASQPVTENADSSSDTGTDFHSQ